MSQYLPTKFGVPIAEGYQADFDLALLRTNQHSGWIRQRRTWRANPSLYTFTYRMSLFYANQMLQWLYGIGDQWFYLTTTTPDTDTAFDCTWFEVRRTTAITITRIPLTDLCTVSFQGETRATNLPPVAYPAQWPANFPLPRATTFTETHDARNRTNYVWTFAVSTALLRAILSFLQYTGTNWFRAPAINANVNCGWEWVRVITNLGFTLPRPNVWELTLTVETMPARWNDQATNPLPPWPPITPNVLTYDTLGANYDDPSITYDGV